MTMLYSINVLYCELLKHSSFGAFDSLKVTLLHKLRCMVVWEVSFQQNQSYILTRAD
jgi:hypothetical protein